MTNVVLFPSHPGPGEAPHAARSAIPVSASPADGRIFAAAACHGWLAPGLAVLAERLDMELASAPPAEVAARLGLPLAFVIGFAQSREGATGPLGTAFRLSTQMSLTEDGLSEDTFYWTGPSEAV
jgi:hypothetical protein